MGRVEEVVFDGGAFRVALKRAGLKQREVAEALEVSPAAVSQWTVGASQPGLSAFRRLCVFVGVPPHELLGLQLRRHVEESWELER